MQESSHQEDIRTVLYCASGRGGVWCPLLLLQMAHQMAKNRFSVDARCTPLTLVLDNVKMAEQFEAFTIRMRGRQGLLFYRAVQLLHLEASKKAPANHNASHTQTMPIIDLLKEWSPSLTNLLPLMLRVGWHWIRVSGQEFGQ